MDTEWIGLIGGLAGTVLGWILSVISTKGKLYFYTDWNDKFETIYRGQFIECTTREQANYYGYDMILDLYNSSNNAKIMRQTEIVFCRGKKELFRVVPKDNSTRHQAGAAYMYDDIQPLTIPAKSVYRINLHGGLHKKDAEFSMLWESDRVLLSYCEKRKREKHVVIKKVNYDQYFINNQTGNEVKDITE